MRIHSLRSIFQSLKSTSHINNFINVDLPAPFLATKATFCHLEIVKST
ncbi:MAG: hypothetical protein WCG25_10025 [bacterium]